MSRNLIIFFSIRDTCYRENKYAYEENKSYSNWYTFNNAVICNGEYYCNIFFPSHFVGQFQELYQIIIIMIYCLITKIMIFTSWDYVSCSPMKSTIKFFIIFLIIFYSELLVLMKIVRIGTKQEQIRNSHLMDGIFTSFYMFILCFCEFYSVVKFCIIFELEGLFQLLPLKVYRYLSIIFCFFSENILFYRILYLSMEIMLIIYFLSIKNSTFAQVYHKYNLKLGLEIDVRNSFIVSRN